MLFSSNNNTRKRSNLHWISTEIYGTRNVVHQTVRIGILMLLVSLPKKSDAVYHILCPVCGSGVFNQTNTKRLFVVVVNAEIKAPTNNNKINK